MSKQYKSYLVGIKLDKYIDEQYIRDRDQWIDATSKENAIAKWKEEREGWLQPQEHRYIHIFEVKAVQYEGMYVRGE